MTHYSQPHVPQFADTIAQHQLTQSQLVNLLQNEIAKGGTRAIAVLILELRRTNRLDAITGDVSTQSIMHYVDQRLDNLLRDADRYAHLSGEQICLVLPGLANKDQGMLAAIRILSELQTSFKIGDYPVTLRPHIGISNSPELGRDPGQLLRYADIASHIAATSERGYHVYRPENQVETEVYRGLDIELGKAIKASELRVHYQPQVDIQTGRCVSAEALVRWTAPGQRETNPGTLVGIAENAGLINPLTLWILNTALRHTAAFSAAGIDIGISVNLPPKMLEDEELPQIIQQSLDTWDVPASRLTLEVTESSMIKDFESSLAMLARLRKLGVRLSIDDFGTGYSSLAYLKHFPVHELKIDMIFIRSMLNSRGDKQLVRAIIDLAHDFELSTVAEGVEDQEAFDLLRDFGCDLAQGFLFSRALPDTEFIDWCRRRAGSTLP